MKAAGGERSRDDGYCSYLTEDRRCSVHDVRPLVCRMYGAAEGLECPYGCPSMGTLSRSQADSLFREAQALSPKLSGVNLLGITFAGILDSAADAKGDEAETDEHEAYRERLKAAREAE